MFHLFFSITQGFMALDLVKMREHAHYPRKAMDLADV